MAATGTGIMLGLKVAEVSGVVILMVLVIQAVWDTVPVSADQLAAVASELPATARWGSGHPH